MNIRNYTQFTVKDNAPESASRFDDQKIPLGVVMENKKNLISFTQSDDQKSSISQSYETPNFKSLMNTPPTFASLASCAKCKTSLTKDNLKTPSSISCTVCEQKTNSTTNSYDNCRNVTYIHRSWEK